MSRLDHVCICCKRAESAEVPGGVFVCVGDNAMRISFFMCDQCAIPLGPTQGPITLPQPPRSPRHSS